MNHSDLLKKNLRVIPDFPKKGIMFQDISTLFSKPECLKAMRDDVIDLYKDKGITKIVGIESRGFLLASSVACELNAGVAMARKPGKLPGNVKCMSYEKEYGTDTICMIDDSIDSNDVVLIHDDLIATGGSLRAVYDLVKTFNPKKVYINTIIELKIEGLDGRAPFKGEDVEIISLLTID